MNVASNNRQEEHETRIPLLGREVSRCYCDTGFGIQFFGKANEFTVRIEGTFTVKLAGQTYSLTPLCRSLLGPALELYGKVVSRAIATQSGALLLTFSDDTELVVQPDDHYEAWELSGPGGYLLVSTSGGGLALWDKRRERNA